MTFEEYMKYLDDNKEAIIEATFGRYWTQFPLAILYDLNTKIYLDMIRNKDNESNISN